MNWYSKRFGKTVWLTHHAKARMQQREVARKEIEYLVESGEVKRKDDYHGWIYAALPDRNDNLLCVAVLSDNAVIIKTLMTHWEEAPE